MIFETPEINIANSTTSSSLSERAVPLEKSSSAEFEIAGDEPPRNTYVIDDLQPGNYVLIAIATWLPEEQGEMTSGYVAYGYKIEI